MLASKIIKETIEHVFQLDLDILYYKMKNVLDIH